MRIDLNADIGEGCPGEHELLTLVTSVNIACGFHAGDAFTMVQSVRQALGAGVAIGAHPSFPDRENFGRTAMHLPPEEVCAQVIYQVGALKALTESLGGRLVHVKPHGMLYNQAAREAPLAEAVAQAVYAVDPALILVGLAGSESIRAARALGLVTCEEAFADRGYQSDGSLVPRGQPGALIDDAELAIRQTLDMVQRGEVQSVTGEWVAVRAETVCLHGDGPHALNFAQRLRQAFRAHHIDVTQR